MAGASAGRPRRLLVLAFGIAAVTTAVLSLDATVVLLTPVVLATAFTLGTHLANSASLLLPVSNLTNLLALAATGISFMRFTALMAAPWLVAIAAEYLVFRRFFAAQLTAAGHDRPLTRQPEGPRFVLTVLAVTLGGFAVSSVAGVNPFWVAFAGALVLAGRALAQRRTTAMGIARAAGVPFMAFVLALAVVVRAVTDNGLAAALGQRAALPRRKAAGCC